MSLVITRLDAAGQQQLQEELTKKGVSSDIAQACSALFSSAAEALEYIGGPDDTGNGFKSPWKEYYSKKNQRFYYCNDITHANQWDLPKPMQLKQWLLDAELFGVDVGLACVLFRRIHSLMEAHWHTPGPLWQCVELLARLTSNVADCNNTNDKYRHIKADNPKVQERVLAVSGAGEVLIAAGFAHSSTEFSFPPVAAPLMMCALRLVASRLNQLVDRRGFTGDAKPVDDDAGATGAPASTAAAAAKHTKWHNTPGFRYQTDIYECSLCSHPINDGSERLFTRAFDAPHGEFRYECEQCAVGSGFNLCEKCWDRMQQEQGALHTPGHTFRTHHPRASRHFMYAQESESNPWGVALGRGGSAARARERLRERTGL